MENTQTPSIVDGKKLTPVFSLIGKAFETYFKGPHIVYIIKITLAQILVGIVAALPLFLIFMLVGGTAYFGNYDPNSSSFPFGLFIPVGVIFAAVAAIVGSWLSATLVVAVSKLASGQIIGVKETLRLGWSKVWKYLGVTLIMGLIVFVGFLFFVIPGLVLGLWFYFALFLVVDKNLGFDSLGKSKELVSGVFWEVAGRNLLFTILYMVIYLVLSFIPVIGPILTIFFAPFYTLLSFLLYKDVLRVKEG